MTQDAAYPGSESRRLYIGIELSAKKSSRDPQPSCWSTPWESRLAEPHPQVFHARLGRPRHRPRGRRWPGLHSALATSNDHLNVGTAIFRSLQIALAVNVLISR